MNRPESSARRVAKRSICLDLRGSAYALASNLVEGGLPVKSVTAYPADADEVVVEIAPNSTVTISAINTVTKSAERSRLAREITVAEYIKARTLENPKAVVSVRAASKATGVSKSSLQRTEAWIAYRTLSKKEATGNSRIRQLTDQMLACVPNHSADDPADIVEAQEAAELARLIEEQRLDAESDHR